MGSQAHTKENEPDAAAGENLLEPTYLEAIYNAMHDGLVVFDMQGKVVLLNEAEAKICGYPNAKAMKKDLDYFSQVFELRSLEGEPVPVEQWPVSKVLRGQSVQNEELRGKRLDTGESLFTTVYTNQAPT